MVFKNLSTVKPSFLSLRREFIATRLYSTDSKSSYSSSSHDAARRKYERKKRESSKEVPSSEIGGTVCHYDRLNIGKRADLAEIKSSYYSLSKQFHPDLTGNNAPDALENFRLITESYEILSDPSSRKEYDNQTNINDTLHKQVNSNDQGSRSSSSQDFVKLFRSQQSDMFFRRRQQALLDLDKLKNPRRYQAGSFRDPNSNLDSEQEEVIIRGRYSND